MLCGHRGVEGRPCRVASKNAIASGGNLCEPARRDPHHPGIGDGGGEAVLEGGGARHPVAGLADAEEREAGGVDVGAGEGEVDDRGDHLLPVEAERQAVLVERRALARAVEDQRVPAALDGGDGAHDQHVDRRAVAAVVEDGDGPPRGRGIGGQPIALKRLALVRDLDLRGRRRPKPDRRVEAGTVRAPGRQAAGRIAGAEHVEEAGRVVFRRAQPGVAGAGPVPGGGRRHGDRPDPVGGRGPLVEPAVGIAVGDPRRGCEAFAGLGAAVLGGAECDLELEVEALLGEELARLQEPLGHRPPSVVLSMDLAGRGAVKRVLTLRAAGLRRSAMAEPPILTLADVGLSFGGDPLFAGVGLAVHPGERIALVGRNGSGKSTLMKLMAGLVEPDAGSRFVRPGLGVGYMAQDPDFAGFATLGAFAGQALPPGEDWRVAAAMEGLKLDPALDPARASGGERRRAALAKILAEAPDLLLLDEPTNHLDIQAIGWLEAHLAATRTAFVAVSHDRAFLRNLTERTLWVDRGEVRRLERGFAGFEEWRDKVLRGGGRGAAQARPADQGRGALGGRGHLGAPATQPGAGAPAGGAARRAARRHRPAGRGADGRSTRRRRPAGWWSRRSASSKAFGGRTIVARLLDPHRARRAGGAGRAERRGQDDAAQHPDRRARARQRPGAARRQPDAGGLRPEPRGARPRGSRSGRR